VDTPALTHVVYTSLESDGSIQITTKKMIMMNTKKDDNAEYQKAV